MRLRPLSRRALVWSHLIYAGVNVLQDFLLILLARFSHGSSPSTCVSLCSLPRPGLSRRGALLALTKWPFLILPLWQIQSSQNWGHSYYSHKSIWEYINISLLLPTFQGCGRFLFQPSSWLAAQPDSLAASSVPVCACMLLTRFCQNCSLPNIITYLLDHRNCDFLPASDWALEFRTEAQVFPFFSWML